MELSGLRIPDDKDLEVEASQVENTSDVRHGGFATLSPADAKKIEKKVVRKQDLAIVLLLSGCTFLNFLVRLEWSSHYALD